MKKLGLKNISSTDEKEKEKAGSKRSEDPSERKKFFTIVRNSNKHGLVFPGGRANEAGFTLTVSVSFCINFDHRFRTETT